MPSLDLFPAEELEDQRQDGWGMEDMLYLQNMREPRTLSMLEPEAERELVIECRSYGKVWVYR